MIRKEKTKERTTEEKIEQILGMSEHNGVKRDLICDIIRETGRNSFVMGKAEAYREMFEVFRKINTEATTKD